MAYLSLTLHTALGPTDASGGHKFSVKRAPSVCTQAQIGSDRAHMGLYKLILGRIWAPIIPGTVQSGIHTGVPLGKRGLTYFGGACALRFVNLNFWEPVRSRFQDLTSKF